MPVKMGAFRHTWGNKIEWLQMQGIICNKNVIIFQKGVAICKRVCYNTVTYIKNKKE